MRLTLIAGTILSLAATSLDAASPVPAPPSAAAPASDKLVLPSPKAGRSRPLVAILAEHEGVQTTDFIIPYGILKDSGLLDVRSLATAPGPIRMTRGLTIAADETIVDFDAREPAGADIVIVPAQADPKHKGLASWLRAQAAKGAVIVSVCEGARLLAFAGLLDGRRAVTHWASLGQMAKAYPKSIWVRDRRYVQDGAIVTTAGVTASIPMSLALVEAAGGREKAEAVAARLGVQSWGASHRTADFAIGKSDIEAAMLARRETWTHGTTEIPVADGVDEVALALQAESWGRSDRGPVVTTHAGRAPIQSRHGLTILPDAEAMPGNRIVAVAALPAIRAFEASLAEMGRRYGPGSTRLATLAMEYDPAPPPAD